MFIASIFALAFISIGLLVVAIALRSRSVATLNFMICVAAGVPIAPWDTFRSLHPPANEDLHLDWLAALIWSVISCAAVLALIFCLIVTIPKEAKRPRERKRKKRRRSRSRSVRGTLEGLPAEDDTFTDAT